MTSKGRCHRRDTDQPWCCHWLNEARASVGSWTASLNTLLGSIPYSSKFCGTIFLWISWLDFQSQKLSSRKFRMLKWWACLHAVRRKQLLLTQLWRTSSTAVTSMIYMYVPWLQLKMNRPRWLWSYCIAPNFCGSKLSWNCWKSMNVNFRDKTFMIATCFHDYYYSATPRPCRLWVCMEHYCMKPYKIKG